MQIHQAGFNAEETATIDRWCKLFKHKKSISLPQIKANSEENAKLQAILAAGRTERDVYAKGYYHRMNVIGDIPKKKSLMGTKLVKPRSDDQYPCYLCSHVAKSKSHLAAHVRYHHPGQSRTAKWRKKDKERIIHDVALNGTRAAIPGTVTALVPPALIGQFIIVDTEGNVKPAKLLNHCPECGNPSIKAHLAAANI